MSEKKHKKHAFPTILHNKQLKFGLLVPVGLLMHEQSIKRSFLHTQFHHRKGAAQKNEKYQFYQKYSKKDNGPTGI